MKLGFHLFIFNKAGCKSPAFFLLLFLDKSTKQFYSIYMQKINSEKLNILVWAYYKYYYMENAREDKYKKNGESSLKDNQILTLITNQCKECQSSMCCPEEECVLFRIEKIITDGK